MGIDRFHIHSKYDILEEGWDSLVFVVIPFAHLRVNILISVSVLKLDIEPPQFERTDLRSENGESNGEDESSGC